MNENMNLYKILKGHEGEVFYSPLCGNVVISDLYDKGYSIRIVDYKQRSILLTSNGRFADQDLGECMLFPSEDQRDWNKWIEEQKYKVPKTWSKLVKNKKANEYGLAVFNNQGQHVFVSTSPIEKSALALLKIHQLIKVGYGGNVINDYFKDYITFSIMCNSDGSFKIYTCTSKPPHIHFHTKEQAEEFLSYPENIKLLKDYFIIQ